MLERKEWLDRIIDAMAKTNEIMKEHGAGTKQDSILIYTTHEKVWFKSENRFGFFETAKEVQAPVELLPLEKDDGMNLDYKLTFHYRGFEVSNYASAKEVETYYGENS